jgi:hypothetical protein
MSSSTSAPPAGFEAGTNTVAALESSLLSAAVATAWEWTAVESLSTLRLKGARGSPSPHRQASGGGSGGDGGDGGSRGGGGGGRIAGKSYGSSRDRGGGRVGGGGDHKGGGGGDGDGRGMPAPEFEFPATTRGSPAAAAGAATGRDVTAMAEAVRAALQVAAIGGFPDIASEARCPTPSPLRPTPYTLTTMDPAPYTLHLYTKFRV